MPVQPQIARWLQQATWQPDGHLFSPAIRGIDRTQHGRDLRAFCRRLGIDPAGRSPHSLRHSYAGLMTATGVRSLVLADWMGHESTATTKGYSTMATRYLAPCRGWPMGRFVF